MRKGVLQQVASPHELYRQPANIFVAGFIGSPAMNLLQGSIDGGAITVGGWTVGASTRLGGRVAVGVRPEDIQLGAQKECVRGSCTSRTSARRSSRTGVGRRARGDGRGARDRRGLRRRVASASGGGIATRSSPYRRSPLVGDADRRGGGRAGDLRRGEAASLRSPDRPRARVARGSWTSPLSVHGAAAH